MKKKLTVYQKPTCSKCRTTLRLLKERGAEFEAINYYEILFTAAQLRGLLKKLALSAREILRKDEPVAEQSAANNGFPFSSGRGTMFSSFSKGIQDVYTRGVLSSSGENGGTCRRICALLIL